LADLILVNKADGEQANSAAQTMNDYRSALHFMQSRFAGWQPSVMACSSLNNQGIDKIWQQVGAFRSALTESGELQQNRQRQARTWMWSETAEALIADLKNQPQVKMLVAELERAVTEGKLPPTVAAQRLIEHYKTGG
jgi:LAO/AO transport system kinase